MDGDAGWSEAGHTRLASWRRAGRHPHRDRVGTRAQAGARRVDELVRRRPDPACRVECHAQQERGISTHSILLRGSGEELMATGALAIALAVLVMSRAA